MIQNRTRYLTLFVLLMWLSLKAAAQQISGVVTDAQDGNPLGWVQVYYEDHKNEGRPTDEQGRFSIRLHKGKTLCFSMMGYETVRIVTKDSKPLRIRMGSHTRNMGEVQVVHRKNKYSRKNNPAVELMKKVIAAKEKTDLHEKDFFKYNRYQKITFGLNEVTDKVFQEGKFKNMPFLKNYVETSPVTGKLTLPLTIDEILTEHIWRKDTRTEKEIVRGKRSDGINEFFSTGDIVNDIIKDCFTDVDVYDDNIRLLQLRFISPISSASAIRFYRYYLTDTLEVDGQECIRVDFTPNNPQDFGFSGALFVLNDSSWQVKRIEMGLPSRSDVNFVEEMNIIQEFEKLADGSHVLSKDQMLVQLTVLESLQKFHVERTTRFRDYAFDAIPEKEFKFTGPQKTDPSALMRSQEFWDEERPVALSGSEAKMGDFMRDLERIKGFNVILYVAKALIGNYIEVTADPKKVSPVDIGPVNTLVTKNFVEGLRLRLSAQTTAALSPHFFLKGYAAYGFGDRRWKGLGEMTYSINRKEHMPHEFPVHNITLSYARDVMSPSDKFLPTDKDNMFIAFKWAPVEHMQYYERYQALYDKEWENGLRFRTKLKRETTEPTGALFYQPLAMGHEPEAGADSHRKELTTTEATVGLTWQPGASWVNTKQRRRQTNQDAPLFGLEHTVGFKGVLQGDYDYHFTEATVYKRFWLHSWGHMDFHVKGGVQWNKVPYPLLIMPPANLSYIVETGNFNLINNMEFLNDRYASLMWSWDLNGKILNRIPGIRALKLREHLGCNVLWGTLSNKNNPFLESNRGDRELFYFPGTFRRDGSFRYNSQVMDPHVPYVEIVAGLHNIFKVLDVNYVHRLTYVKDNTQKWGIRIFFKLGF